MTDWKLVARWYGATCGVCCLNIEGGPRYEQDGRARHVSCHRKLDRCTPATTEQKAAAGKGGTLQE